jgi:2-amino-4-hydroxy-6-hydroxymethyldihydropteridine diphosphokinase
MTTAFIAFGGNLGDVREAFRGARDELAALPGSGAVASSRLYRSEAIGPPGQPDYLNAVVGLGTELMPRTLLHEMQRIEERHGRVRDLRWGPRTLDLDLVAMDDTISDAADLTLPHPEMHARMFVLQPLCDLAPEWHHPRMGQTARELLESCIRAGQSPLDDGIPW